MQKIAEAGGVSRMTVSLAMRNSPKVSGETRARIRALAEKMGYRPNPLVSALMAQRSGRKRADSVYPLALLNCSHRVANFTDAPFYRRLLEGIERRARELGFYAQMFPFISTDAADSKRLDKILRARGIRGVIVLPLPEGETALDAFPWEHYAPATLGHSLLSPEIHRSASDQFRNGWMAMENIRRLGYRRPGLIIPPGTDLRTHFHFPAAYFAFPRAHPEIKVCPTFPFGAAADSAEFPKWMKKVKPDVLLAHGDIRASLAPLGLRIPADIGFVNLNLLDSDAGVSGIDPLPALVGAGVVDIVVARLHRAEFGLPSHSRTLLITGEWVEGKTTRVAATKPLKR